MEKTRKQKNVLFWSWKFLKFDAPYPPKPYIVTKVLNLKVNPLELLLILPKMLKIFAKQLQVQSQ